MHETPVTAVFDLDGTLLDGESTGAWMTAQAARSPPRLVLAWLAFPIAFPMILIPSLRRMGASILLWIVTVGVSDDELARSFAAFAEKVASGRGKPKWRAKGLEVVADHVRQGHRVVIATAAPEVLAKALLRAAGLDLPVLGSLPDRIANGLAAGRHCRHEAKCDRLREEGYGERWAFAYSDSIDDLPLLARATAPHLVNCRGERERQALSAKLPALGVLTW